VLRAIRNIFILLILVGLAGAGLYGWWDLDLRWRPHEITHDQAEIGKLLDRSDWVSPGAHGGPKLYLVTYRGSAEGQRFIDETLPALQKAGADTRVIMIARADDNGASRSTPAERSTVAELWMNRRWSLFTQWMAAEPDTWAATGIAPADDDVARAAVVEVGRDAADKLQTLLRDSGVRFDYPVVIWWTKDGKLMALTGGDPHGDRYVLKDLAGAPSPAAGA
jgi:hypothetical protein